MIDLIYKHAFILGKVVTWRLTRMNVVNCSDPGSGEVLLTVQSNLSSLVQCCLVNGDRTIAHKCAKLIALCLELVSTLASFNHWFCGLATDLFVVQTLHWFTTVFVLRSVNCNFWPAVHHTPRSTNAACCKWHRRSVQRVFSFPRSTCWTVFPVNCTCSLIINKRCLLSTGFLFSVNTLLMSHLYVEPFMSYLKV